jgi:tripartite-type tricarboxylate transporter receptor subunit TctC
MKRLALVVLPLLCFASSAFAQSESVADFYKGKQLRIVIGFPPGGGYDVYARAIARHMGKHIPGNPTIVPQNMDGAGSRTASNWLYSVAPRDGTVFGTATQSIATDQARGEEGVKYDVAKFGWIGNPVLDNLVTMSYATSGVATLEDVKTKGGMICGTSGVTSPAAIYPQIINELTGAKMKVISGYTGSTEYALAMERGELNCMGGIAWSAVEATLGPMLADRRLNILVQAGPEKQAAVEAYAKGRVPMIIDYAKTDDDRRALDLIISGVTVGRPLFTPPEVPADRLAALRAAFEQTMKDKDFLAEAEKQKINIAPISGTALQKIVTDVATASPAVLKRMQELVTPKGAVENRPGK